MNELAALAPTRHKLDVYDFFRMVETGIVADQARVELIDGALIDMSPIGEDHAGTVSLLNELLGEQCYRRVVISIQNPVRLDRYTELYPDIAICRRRADFYRSEHAGPSDVFLLIEVANSSLEYDLAVKLALYARSGIPEYWIVDLVNRRLIVHRTPGPDGYADTVIHDPATPLALAASPDIVINLTALFL